MAQNFEVRVVDERGQPSTSPRSEPLPLPARFEVVPTSDSEPSGFGLFVTLREQGDGLEVDELTVRRADSPSGVTTATLRKVPIPDVLTACRNALGHYGRSAIEGETWGDWSDVFVVGDKDVFRTMDLRMIRKKAKGFPPLVEDGAGGFTLGDSDYVHELRKAGPSSERVHLAVRGLYTFAESRDLAPVGFVASVLGLPQATASHWIRLTRKAGQLPPASYVSRNRGAGKNGA